METVSGIILNVVNFMLYSFWFALLVFVLFILYMTFVTIKAKEQNIKTAIKKKEYKEYYKSLLYSIPLLAMIVTALYIDIM